MTNTSGRKNGTKRKNDQQAAGEHVLLAPAATDQITTEVDEQVEAIQHEVMENQKNEEDNDKGQTEEELENPQNEEELYYQRTEEPQCNAPATDNNSDQVQPQPKKRRGPTKMKDIAKDPNARVKVDFTELGEPCGEGSVTLSSYLGPLVREHVPVTIEDWRKIGEERKIILWKSVQGRFELDGEYEKTYVLKHMGCLWRASKSRLVSQIINAKNNAERMKLKPKNVPNTEWRKFIRLKTSTEFKVVSDKYKERRRSQIPHTCSRRGMVRLAEDLKKETSDPAEVTRVKVWVKSRTKKDGTPVNTNAAEKIKKATELLETGTFSSTATHPKEDALSQILGPDNPGRLRAMGRAMNMSKLACFQVNNKSMAEMQKNQADLRRQVHELQDTLNKINSQRPETEVGENSAARSVNNRTQPKCLLFDWCGGDEKVAEGRIMSSDPDDFVSDIRLGPSSFKVLVETAFKPDAFLWRPTTNMFTIENSVGGMIAWPKDFAVVFDHQDYEIEDIPPKSPNTNSLNSCKLLDWVSNNEDCVAEGRWQSQDAKALVNGIPLGPIAVKVFIDKVIVPDAFLWRPTADLTNLSDCLKAFVSWPVSRVVFSAINVGSPYPVCPLQQSAVTPPAPTKKSQISPQSHTQSSLDQRGTPEKVDNENKKCMLMDVTGQKRVVAEGRWSTNNPDQKVHFVPLGPEAVCVWVEVVKVHDAVVWKPSSAIEFMEDALGTTVAWPEDKVIII